MIATPSSDRMVRIQRPRPSAVSCISGQRLKIRPQKRRGRRPIQGGGSAVTLSRSDLPHAEDGRPKEHHALTLRTAPPVSACSSRLNRRYGLFHGPRHSGSTATSSVPPRSGPCPARRRYPPYTPTAKISATRGVRATSTAVRHACDYDDIATGNRPLQGASMSPMIERLSFHVVQLVTRPGSVGNPSARNYLHGTPFIPFLRCPSRNIYSSSLRTG